jgi:hypothetical protein
MCQQAAIQHFIPLSSKNLMLPAAPRIDVLDVGLRILVLFMTVGVHSLLQLALHAAAK